MGRYELVSVRSVPVQDLLQPSKNENDPKLFSREWSLRLHGKQAAQRSSYRLGAFPFKIRIGPSKNVGRVLVLKEYS